jgi:hypothetical protein
MDEENEYESLDSDEETSSVIEHDVSDEEIPEFMQHFNSPVPHNPHNRPQLDADGDVIMEELGPEEMDVDEGRV